MDVIVKLGNKYYEETGKTLFYLFMETSRGNVGYFSYKMLIDRLIYESDKKMMYPVIKEKGYYQLL